MPAATLDVSSAGGCVNMHRQKNNRLVRNRTSARGRDAAMKLEFDVAIVGAGIVGLAHALAAARLGKRVVVIDREPRATGASVRNFGFVTVTGQARGAPWRRAVRARQVWEEIAPQAGVDILQRGLLLLFRRPESADVVEEFLATEMAVECEMLSAHEARRVASGLGGPDLLGALRSRSDLRVDSRQAIPRLAAWLEAAHGVTFLRSTAVLNVEPPRIETSRGTLSAETCVVCPGDDLSSLFPDALAAHQVSRCTLSMLRLASPGMRLPCALMSDLGLARYLGYARLPAAARLLARLQADQAEELAQGVHLIVVQGVDGDLIVGDSHTYGEAAEPFARADVERLILNEFEAACGIAPPAVVERWTGSYAWSPTTDLLVAAPEDGVRLVVVTAGNGASTAFAVAEEVVGEMFGMASSPTFAAGVHA
jgi:FAD dependent oxidoreductase TIGR03364